MIQQNINLLIFVILLQIHAIVQTSNQAALDKNYTQQAQTIINNAFKDIDNWRQKNAFTNNYNILTNLEGDNPINNNSKIETATNYIYDALDNLNTTIDNSNMVQLKNAATRALQFFSTESDFDSQVLNIIIDSIKIVLVAPIKIAVRLAAEGTGIAAGAVGGAGVGLGSGIYKTAKNLSTIKFIAQDGTLDMSLVAQALPKMIIYSLYGIVETSILTAYSTVEGLVIGDIIGQNLGATATGNIFTLSKNPNNSSNKENSSDQLQKATLISEEDAEHAALQQRPIDQQLKESYETEML